MVGGLGPRVGGAHVDVNMKMDDGSISTVGRQIHKQLSSLNDRLVKIGESNRHVYQSIGQNAVTAWRAALGATVTAAPLIGSAMSATAGAATMLGGALYSVSQSSAALIPVATSLGLAGITASIGMRNFGAAVSEVDPKKLQQLLADMPKSMQDAVMSTRAMSKEMRAVIWEKLFVGVGPLMERLKETGVIQRGLGQMANSINGVVRGVLRYVSSAKGVAVLDDFFANNAKVFSALGRAVVPFLDGFLRLVNALTPAALRFANGLTDVGKRFQSWTQGEGFAKRIDESMKKAQKTAGLFFDVLGNIGAAVRNVFNAANPATNTFLQMLVDVTQRFQDWTESAGGKNTIAEWASQSVDVMRQFGRTAEAVFKVIAELADPRVIISFLKTLQGAFEILGKLPLDKIVDGYVRIAEALQPVSSAFLAVIIAGAAFNIMLGGIMGQLGGLFSVLAKIIQFKILANILRNTGGGAKAAGEAAEGAAKKGGFLARAWAGLVGIFNRVKAALSGVFGFFSKTNTATAETASKVSRLGSVFKPVMSILARVAKFAGPVGLAVWIGSIIAKSDSLKEKLGEVWGSMKGVWNALVGAFKEIGTALAPLKPVADAAGKGLGFIFDALDKIMGLAIGVVLDTIVYGFKSVANVIKGVGKIIAGFINVLVGLFTLDFGKVLDGLKQMASGVWPLLKGLFGVFVTFFAPARLAKLAGTAMKGLWTGLKGAMPGILSAVGQFLVRLLQFFATLPARLLSLGVRAFQGLMGAVKSKGPGILAAAGRIVLGIMQWVARLPGRLMALGGRAFSALLKAVVKYVPKLLQAAGRITLGILNWIARLPGRLLALGREAISRLWAAVKAGTPKVLAAAGRIFTGVANWIAKLPGRLLDLGKSAVGKLGDALRNGISKVKGVAGDIFDAIWNGVKDLPGKLFNIGAEMIGKLASGLISKLSSVAKAAGSVAGKIKDAFPGSPVKDGPLRAWNYGGDASGGGRNLIEQFAKGLRDITPVQKAISDVADSIAMGTKSPTGRRVGGVSRSGTEGHGTQFPQRLVLRIGGRDFEAFLEPLVDSRVAAGQSLATQGGKPR